MTREKKKAPPAPRLRPRDKQATRRRLIEAVGVLLAREGFAGLGVNAVAREAGVDKVLIYRYFGGLPELLTVYGREGDFWPTVVELAGGDVAAALRRPLPDRVALLLKNFARALRKRPVTLEIMAWEVLERNELTVLLEEVREKTAVELAETFGSDLSADGSERSDLPAVVALLASALMYLAVRAGRGTRKFNMVDLQSEEGWHRLDEAIEVLLRGWDVLVRDGQ
ncbi:MAG: TetR/AcrR family transcriptional regulator [Thermodesulfobacteriota bacterium]